VSTAPLCRDTSGFPVAIETGDPYILTNIERTKSGTDSRRSSRIRLFITSARFEVLLWPHRFPQ